MHPLLTILNITGLKNRPIIEITDENPKYTADCIVSFCEEGLVVAKKRFGQGIPLDFRHYFSIIEPCLLRDCRYLDAARSLIVTAKRYGWAKQLVDFGTTAIAPRLSFDPSWIYGSNRRFAEEFRSALDEASKNPILLPSQTSIARG